MLSLLRNLPALEPALWCMYGTLTCTSADPAAPAGSGRKTLGAV